MKIITSALLLITLFVTPKAPAQDGAAGNQVRPGTKNIVFVCEHGAALSVVSAAYFNKLAQEQHLNWHAVARGVTPQENLSVSAAAGLKKDRLPTEVTKPQEVTQEDLDRADYVVTFLPLPEKLVLKTPLESWEDVKWAPSGYDKIRDEILKHIQQLVLKLKTKRKR